VLWLLCLVPPYKKSAISANISHPHHHHQPPTHKSPKIMQPHTHPPVHYCNPPPPPKPYHDQLYHGPHHSHHTQNSHQETSFHLSPPLSTTHHPVMCSYLTTSRLYRQYRGCTSPPIHKTACANPTRGTAKQDARCYETRRGEEEFDTLIFDSCQIIDSGLILTVTWTVSVGNSWSREVDGMSCVLSTRQ
jgi:hypothetical protein